MHHGLNTCYPAFCFFLQDNYSAIHADLIEYFGLPFLDRNDCNSRKNKQWKEFEKALADLDFEAVLDDNTDFLVDLSDPNFRDRDWHAFSIEMEKVVDNLTVNLFEAFKRFILNVMYPENLDHKKLKLEKNAFYLNFNYTDTLEKYYRIPRKNILYIHNKADFDSKVLILGHGIHPGKFEVGSFKMPQNTGDEISESWEDDDSIESDYSYKSAKDELLEYFTKSLKNTSRIIEENMSFFQSIKDVSDVIVLGHSLSEVDIPYLKEVAVSISKSALWSVTYYKDDEKKKFQRSLANIGIVENHINLIKMDDLQDDIQMPLW